MSTFIRPLVTGLPRFGVRAAMVNAAHRVPMGVRPYTTKANNKPGNSPLLFLGLTALGGAGHYYYRKNYQEVKDADKDKTAEKSKAVDYNQVYKDIAEILEDNDYDDGSYGPILLRLAWHSSGTFDKDTKTGGSNGATMRFAPESNHGANAGLGVARDRLEEIKRKYPDMSYGDLWTLAGVVAVQELGGPIIPWRPGRQDAVDATSAPPDGRLPDATQKEKHARDIFYRMGFNDQEIVALMGGHALGRCHPDRSGFDGPWIESPTVFSNEYFKALTERTWIKKSLPNGGWQYVDKSNPDVMMLPIELFMYADKNFKTYFDLYAKDEDKFFEDFAKAFKKLIELGVPFKGDEKEYHFPKLNE